MREYESTSRQLYITADTTMVMPKKSIIGELVTKQSIVEIKRKRYHELYDRLKTNRAVYKAST